MFRQVELKAHAVPEMVSLAMVVSVAKVRSYAWDGDSHQVFVLPFLEM